MLFTTGINDERIVDISTLLECSATERGSVRGVLVLLGRPMSEDMKMLLLHRDTADHVGSQTLHGFGYFSHF